MRDLTPAAGLALTAIVVLAVFAWTERTVLVDPEGSSDSYWPWRLWQIAPLVIALGGVWWIWLGTARLIWLRSLALGLLVLAIFVNAYTGGFGEHAGNVWRTINPLYIACASVAAVRLWDPGRFAKCTGAALSAGLVGAVFANGYFVGEAVIWQIVNPLMMLTALTWAAGVGPAGAARGTDPEPG
ncbi:MAG: hypothetical protein OXS30_07580 [Chloroflexota bacterium]|nr:hypothetical protein [Chloroflexota bacterium]